MVEDSKFSLHNQEDLGQEVQGEGHREVEDPRWSSVQGNMGPSHLNTIEVYSIGMKDLWARIVMAVLMGSWGRKSIHAHKHHLLGKDIALQGRKQCENHGIKVSNLLQNCHPRETSPQLKWKMGQMHWNRSQRLNQDLLSRSNPPKEQHPHSRLQSIDHSHHPGQSPNSPRDPLIQDMPHSHRDPKQAQPNTDRHHTQVQPQSVKPHQLRTESRNTIHTPQKQIN